MIGTRFNPPHARRSLTTAERALWRAWAAAANVRPLSGQELDAEAASTMSVAMPKEPPVAASAPRSKLPSHPSVEIGRVPDGIDARRWREFGRGRIRPERVLDLHGRRAQEAHAATRGFLMQAVADGLRCVTIVTGKGGVEGGVLRRELPHWLNAADIRPLLLAAAHPHSANQGAVDILLRRSARLRR